MMSGRMQRRGLGKRESNDASVVMIQNVEELRPELADFGG
jgi:hypothetical protein